MSTTTPRHYCHMCNAEVPIYMAPDPTCQTCHEQFIEEIEDTADDPRQFLASEEENPHPSLFPSDTDNYGVNDENTLGPFFEGVMAAILGNNNLRQTFMGGSGQEGEGNHGVQRSPLLIYSGVLDSTTGFPRAHTMRQTAGEETTQPSDPLAPHPTDEQGQGNENNRANNMASVFQLLQTLAGAPLDVGIVGNPNDYVFSQGALDNIISQLMDQTVGRTAPPPAPDDVVESLVHRALTQNEQDTQVDCAVCKDEFDREEKVIELPCLHIFHDDCIKPWLKMNGTCPVCRHSVVPSTSQTDAQQEETPAATSSASVDANTNTNTTTNTTTDTNTNTNTQSTTDIAQVDSDSDIDTASTNDTTATTHLPSDTTTPRDGENQEPASPLNSLLSWFGRPRSERGTHPPSWTPGVLSASSWPANIPSDFTWGPGQGQGTEASQTSEETSRADNEDTIDLDLD